MSGSININLDATDFSFDSNSVDFDDPIAGKVNDATGDFAYLIGSDIARKDFTYTAIPEGGIEDLWEVVGAGVSFSLAELLYSNYNPLPGTDIAFLTLHGKGWLNVDGEGSFPARWTFSADENNGVYNYSSTTNVPDSGASVAMLGFGLLCLGAVSRLRRREAAA